jgi:hypothetical protein
MSRRTAARLINQRGKRLTRSALRPQVDKARLVDAEATPAMAYEIKRMWFYDLRAKADDDTADGLGDEAASNLLGHEDLRTTRRHDFRRGTIVAPTK